MRVALFHSEFVYSGGAEKLIFKQVDYLRKRKWQIDIYSAFVDEKKCYPDLIKNYSIKQILPKFLNRLIPNDLMVILTTIFFPLSAIRYSNYDIFVGENQAGPWWVAMAAMFWRKPYFTYQPFPTTFTYPRKIDKDAKRNAFLTDLIIKIFKPLIIWFDKIVIRGADVSFSNGEYAWRVLEKVYQREFINCPAGADLGKFNKAIFERRFSGEFVIDKLIVKKPYILITNRHFRAKRLDFGVQVVKKLITNYDLQITLVITGRETKYTEEIKTLTKKMKVEHKIIFTGLVDENQLGRLYQNALVYIYTAPEEDFGMGIVEAMAKGVSVVAWNNTGPKYIVKNSKTGYLAKLNDLDDFVKKVSILISNKTLNLKFSEIAYSTAKNYTWKKHGQILEKWLKSHV